MRVVCPLPVPMASESAPFSILLNFFLLTFSSVANLLPFLRWQRNGEVPARLNDNFSAFEETRKCLVIAKSSGEIVGYIYAYLWGGTKACGRATHRNVYIKIYVKA